MAARASLWAEGWDADMVALLAMEREKSCLLELAEQLAHVGHWSVRLSDRAVTWSPEVYRIHGVTPDTFTPDLETAVGFYHPEDRAAVDASIAAAARNATPFEFSLRLIRADGELRHVRSRGLTIAGPDKAPAQIFGVFVDVTEQRKAEELLHETNQKLERIAYADALTGLANRRHFDQVLEREWRRAAREQTALSLVMLDIDRFKVFNDLYGHVVGDACLRRVAAALAALARRPGDLAARYGGEEFALILPRTDVAGGEAVARAAHRAVPGLGLTHLGNHLGGGVVTASFGVATAYPQLGGSPTPWIDLIAEADALLYEAKRTGRNRVVAQSGIAGHGPAPLPENEAARLAALAMYEQAGATGRAADLDRIARLAATLTSTPIGLISLVGQDQQHFIGNFGLEGVDSTGRDVSFCAHTILGDEPFVVADAARDRRFEDNALVTGGLGLRYYAGAPIVSVATGHRLGALCVIDRSARTTTTPAQRAILVDLAAMAAMILEQKAAPTG